MVPIQIAIALTVAILLSLVVVAWLGWQWPGRGRGSSLLFVALVVFLTAWAGGVWITPFGPALLGLMWMPFALAGLAVTLLLLAVLPPSPPDRDPRRPADVPSREATGLFLWVLLLFLILAIVAGGFWTVPVDGHARLIAP